MLSRKWVWNSKKRWLNCKKWSISKKVMDCVEKTVIRPLKFFTLDWFRISFQYFNFAGRCLYVKPYDFLAHGWKKKKLRCQSSHKLQKIIYSRVTFWLNCWHKNCRCLYYNLNLCLHFSINYLTVKTIFNRFDLEDRINMENVSELNNVINRQFNIE